ncbi:MAG TPA: DUF72 domain-containing protein [Myxococcaceae bacterium]|nr:DUF72 domain-containing protein [Myxococcaceae bacterium]
MASVIRVGPAGWSYKDWDGIVYPKKKPRGFDPLEFLARYFDALEINSTFYRPHPRSVVKQWLERVAPFPSFRFTAKLYRRFTHERETVWTKDEVREARDGLDAMHEAERLGAVLLQFPWSFRRGEHEQEWLRDLLQAFSGLPLVVEVRHLSWNVPEFFSELEQRGVGFVNVDQPMFRNSIAPSARSTAHVGYVRVHGRNYHDWFRKDAGRDARYDYLYTPRQLEEWADRARSLAEDEKTREVYVVTNNHFRGQAVTNGLQLRAMLERRRVEAPRSLVEAFPEPLRPFVTEPNVADGEPRPAPG